ncbi:MAG: adenylate/guanylate cyclase domain-containing protein [Myxococcota bacterium]
MLADESPRLVIRFVRTDGAIANLTVQAGQSVQVGRDPSCEFQLEGRKVSRRHVRLSVTDDGQVRLEDSGSHNGTFVNGVRSSESLLSGGELLHVGEWEGRAEVQRGTITRRRPTAGLMPAVDLNRTRTPHGNAAASPDTPSKGSEKKISRPLPRSALIEAMDTPTGFDTSIPPTLMPPGLESPVSDTRIVDMKGVWRWQEADPSTDAPQDSIRAAPVVENPIVKRLTQSHGALDFRGLGDLPDENPSASLGASFNVDIVALQLVFKVTEALHAASSMEAFLADMSDSLCTSARAKAVVVLLPDEATGELNPRVVRNRREGEKIQLSRTVIEWAIQQRSAVATEDASADERFATGESILRFDLKAVLVVPLMREQDCIGALYLTRDLPFSNTERDLVAAIAHLIAVGLERSRLREHVAVEERQRRALERFHAPDVVRRLMMEETAPVSARGDGLFLEQLKATVLFCDLSGFTRFCESHDPEEVGRLLNLYLGAMTEIVFAHGGTVDKYIGDAIMCIFGAPFSQPDDALRAVRCAIEMRKTFHRLRERGQLPQSEPPLDVHIGVNTGPVVAGTVGSALRMEYTALGDTVNLAARLEGTAKAGQIVIGPATAELVKNHVMLSSLGQVTLKGKRFELEVFEVLDAPPTRPAQDFERDFTIDGDVREARAVLREMLASRAAMRKTE